MAIGVSNRWPDPPEGYLTTKGVIELGSRLQADGRIKYPIPQPQVLLTWLNKPPRAKRMAEFPMIRHEPLAKRHLRRGPGPKGGRYEWPISLAERVQEWYSQRLETELARKNDGGSDNGR